MFLANHTLTGTLLALTINHPVALVPAAFGSHLLLDATPHFGFTGLSFSKPNGKLVAAIDASLSLTVFLAVLNRWPGQAWLLLLGVFFATLPDLLYIPRQFFEYVPSQVFARVHKNLQWSETPPGMIVEMAWLLAMIYLLSQF